MQLKTYLIFLFFTPLFLLANSTVYDLEVQPEVVIAPLKSFEKKIIDHREITIDFSALVNSIFEITPIPSISEDKSKTLKTKVVIDDVIVFLQEDSSFKDAWVYTYSDIITQPTRYVFKSSPG